MFAHQSVPPSDAAVIAGPGHDIQLAKEDGESRCLGRHGWRIPKRMGVEGMPAWLSVHTRKVLGAFVGTLGTLPNWERIYVISPWLSSFGRDCGMSFEQFVKRVRDERPNLFVVTRPPEESWHRDAIEALAATGSANIALLPNLHAKLFVADTKALSVCLVTSANFTAQSLINQEIGLLIRGKGEGQRIVRRLHMEAAQIYRTEGRKLHSQRKL